METADARVIWTQTDWENYGVWLLNGRDRLTLKEAKALAKKLARQMPCKTKVQWCGVGDKDWETKAEYGK